MVHVKMVGGQLWNAKQDEEQAKALVKEELLAVAMHRGASLLKSLPNSTRRIGQKHPGEQQLLQEIVQTKVAAKAKEAKERERPRVTSRVPRWLGLLAPLLILLTMSYPTSPSSTARTLPAQALQASAPSNFTKELEEEPEDGTAMAAVCPGSDLGKWRIVERFFGHMYLQAAQIKTKAKDAAPTRMQSPRTRCYKRRVTCSNVETL